MAQFQMKPSSQPCKTNEKFLIQLLFPRFLHGNQPGRGSVLSGRIKTMETQPVRIRKQQDFTGLIIRIVIAILTMAAAMAAYTVTRALVSSWNLTNMPGEPVAFDPLSFTDQTPEFRELWNTGPIPTLPAAIQPTPVQWDGVKRITILVLGLDYRDWEAGEKPGQIL